MDKKQFLDAVRARLAGLPREDIDRSLEYYGEMIDDYMEDGMTEEEAVAAIGSVDEVVLQIGVGTAHPARYHTPHAEALPMETSSYAAPEPPRDKTDTYRARRNAVIVAVCIVAAALVGRLLFRGGVGLRGHGGSLTDYTVRDIEAFESIDISTVEAAVGIVPAKDGQCCVTSRAPKDMQLSVEVIDGTLTIRSQDRRPWYKRLGLWLVGDAYVTVYLPEAEYGTLAVRTVSGDIAVTEPFSFTAVSLESTSGDVSFTGGAGSSLYAGSTSGFVGVDKARAADVTVQTVSGDVWLSELTADTFELSTTSGEVSSEAVLVSGAASFESVSGDIWFYDSDAGSLRFKTISGDVDASLISAKNFITHTTSGDVRVPESDASAGDCEVTTTSGDIDLHFALVLD